jgi:hypothetical protein
MSYDELRLHAQRIEELAKKAALDDRGITLVNGQYVFLQSYNPVPAEIVSFAQEEFQGLAEVFEPFLDLPDPAALDAMYNDLHKVVEALASGATGLNDPVHGEHIAANLEMTKMEMVQDVAFAWTGRAAKQFYTQIAAPWDAVTVNQFNLVAVLAGAIAAEKALWQECRQNVDELAHRAIEAFEALDGDNQIDFEVLLLTVAASVFSIGTVYATGGTSILSLAMAGATAQVAATAVDKFSKEETPRVLFDAQTPVALAEQVKQALYQLMYIACRKEQEIADAMTTTSAFVASKQPEHIFPRPLLADQTRGSVLGQQGLGRHR